ncbi:MAG: hypothetical protein ILP19_03500, partial [Oscillospiraceae bacterium]|nr:hypothetical protein [Oscillospiraceae bacterium]
TSGTTDATDEEYRNQTNVTEIIATGTSFSQDFYLQHGNYIAIQGLPEGATYTVTEDKEDYSGAKNATISSIEFNGGNASDESITGTLSADTDVGFTNTKIGVIPTGILLSFTPLFVIGGIAVAGIIFLMIRRRRAE